jgi:hypothetical protein
MAERLTLSDRADRILGRVEGFLARPGELTPATALETLREMAKLLRDMAHSVEWMEPPLSRCDSSKSGPPLRTTMSGCTAGTADRLASQHRPVPPRRGGGEGERFPR